MKALLVAGSRSFERVFDRGVPVSGWSPSYMFDILDQASYALDMTFDTVIHGAARGVDIMAGSWAGRKGYPVVEYPAEWERFGKYAGYRRNVQMVADCAAAILIWDGESKGTRHTLDLLIMAAKPFVLVRGDSRRPE